MARRDVVVLGSTGSIGTQALDIVRAQPGPVPGRRADRRRQPPRTCFEQQVAEFAPAVPRARARTPRSRPPAMDCDVVLNGITGAVGLRPTLAALEAGTTLALANKESLIIGGPVVTGLAKPGPDRAGRLRALRARAVPARRLAPTRYAVSCSPRAADRSGAAAARTSHDVTPSRRAAPPDLGHGPGGDHQLRHPGQQGARGDRGPPALRHPVRPDRGRGPPHLGGALDGRVRRRLHAGSGLARRRC